MSLRLPLFLLVALSLPLSAQKTKPSGKTESGLTVRLLGDVVPESHAQVFLQSGDSKSTELDLPTARLSEPIAVTARSMVLKAVGNDTPLCSITLPAEGKAFAVLLAQEKPPGLVPFVVRTDDPAFKAGDLIFVNRTAKTLALKLGGTALVLEAGKTAKSRPSGAVDNAYDIVISERDPAGDKLVTSSRWPVEVNLRSYVFFSTNARGKTTFRAVDEYLEAPGGKKKR